MSWMARTYRCRDCGAVHSAGSRGRLPTRCPDCKHRARRLTKVAVVCACGCGETLPAARSANRRYFGGACRMRAMRARAGRA